MGRSLEMQIEVPVNDPEIVIGLLVDTVYEGFERTTGRLRLVNCVPQVVITFYAYAHEGDGGFWYECNKSGPHQVDKATFEALVREGRIVSKSDGEYVIAPGTILTCDFVL